MQKVTMQDIGGTTVKDTAVYKIKDNKKSDIICLIDKFLMIFMNYVFVEIA